MKRVLVIATGGTIASEQTVDGRAPALTGEDLLAYVPDVREHAQLDVVQPMNIDSTNMSPDGWLSIAAEVERAYTAYDGFVVLHGTDTLAYTAAALSYLVQGSSKPIVLTGSQVPMGQEGSDAPHNVRDAVAVACDGRAAGVCVAFFGRVIAGTRARKARTRSLDAFESVDAPELGQVAEDGKVELFADGASAGPAVSGGVRFFHRLDTRVQVLKLSPGMDASFVGALRRHVRALVVETFGIGGVPEYGGIANALLDWAGEGRFLVMTTQVPHEGCDMGVYEVGHAFASHPGILQGGDMTTEALVAKTMWALGQAGDDGEVRALFERGGDSDCS